jgi:hypothetical protein
MRPEERRNHSRFPFSSRLEVRQRRGGRTMAGEDVERVARATAIDVSVTGLGFRSALPLAVGDFITVSLPDANPEGGLGAESPVAPRGHESFEILAVVRHVEAVNGEYMIGAERRSGN